MSVAGKDIKLEINDYQTSIKVFIPTDFQKALIIANGAGANMESPFMYHYARSLSERGILTVRFNFHYQEIGRKFPDKNEKCQETYLVVVKHIAKEFTEEQNIVIGGKSMGGRIATQIAGQLSCQKIVVFGYPLHPPGKPEKRRDAHLYGIDQHVLIIQGQNDAFGRKDEMDRVISKMRNARLLSIDQANHSLKIPKKAHIDSNKVKENIINEVSQFVKS